jgi:hypothetical protein
MPTHYLNQLACHCTNYKKTSPFSHVSLTSVYSEVMSEDLPYVNFGNPLFFLSPFLAPQCDVMQPLLEDDEPFVVDGSSTEGL